MADETKDDKAAEGTPDGGGSRANLGMFLGMFVTLALVLGGVTVFLQPAAEDPGQTDPSTAKEAKEGKGKRAAAGEAEAEGGVPPRWVRVSDLAFAFAGTRLKKKAAVTIVFRLPCNKVEDAEFFKDLLGDPDKDGFSPVRTDKKSGRMLLKALKRFFLAKKDDEFYAPDSEERVAKELRAMIQRYIREDLQICCEDSPLVGTVDYCDINVNPY